MKQILVRRECIETVRTYEEFVVDVKDLSGVDMTDQEAVEEWLWQNHWEYYGDVEYDETLDNQVEDLEWREYE